MVSSIFFLLFRLPPSSPLFPYTTLFRSQGFAGDYPYLAMEFLPSGTLAARIHEGLGSRAALRITSQVARSEEHTSELQSRFDLVCRLLLEKKKTNSQHLKATYVCPRINT